jgi:predicted double-glycine peptidase
MEIMITHARYTFYMTQKRDMPYFKQEKDYSCGPAALRMVLASFSVAVDEPTLRSRMKTGPIFGTRHHQLLAVAHAYGLHGRTKIRASFEDIANALTQGRDIIVTYVEPSASASHMAPVIALDDERIVLNDPWYGPGTSLSRDEFYKRWQSQNRLGKGNWYPGWMLEISDKPLDA